MIPADNSHLPQEWVNEKIKTMDETRKQHQEATILLNAATVQLKAELVA